VGRDHGRLPRRAGTTQHNSYGTGSSGAPNTTVLGAPMDVRRCGGNFNFASTATPGTISMFFSTSGSIARVDVDVPGNLQSTIPVLAASGDTPYFGANPQLDMTASIPGAQAGLLAALAPASRSASRPRSAAC
jgi:hypothetical protein